MAFFFFELLVPCFCHAKRRRLDSRGSRFIAILDAELLLQEWQFRARSSGVGGMVHRSPATGALTWSRPLNRTQEENASILAKAGMWQWF